jgi:hypothetical protein
MAKSTKTQSTTVSRTTRPRRPRNAPDTTATSDVSTTTNSSLDPSAIAMRAYELYLADGAMPGRDLEHWLRAENELRGRVALSAN